jgi:hypothetical protein
VLKTMKTAQRLKTAGVSSPGDPLRDAYIQKNVTHAAQQTIGGGRWVLTLCKGKAGLRQQLALYQVYDNFCLPHAKSDHMTFVHFVT